MLSGGLGDDHVRQKYFDAPQKPIPVVEVSGLRGGTVELPCDVSHPPNDEVLLLLWFRDPLTTPIFRGSDVRSLGGRLLWGPEAFVAVREAWAAWDDREEAGGVMGDLLVWRCRCWWLSEMGRRLVTPRTPPSPGKHSPDCSLLFAHRHCSPPETPPVGLRPPQLCSKKALCSQSSDVQAQHSRCYEIHHEYLMRPIPWLVRQQRQQRQQLAHGS
ncbi:hypothetical protein O3P69_001558 [Scylla paramamosain]|uniref:Ig-like domain-containing protein n=1 Tax=Scylla paramamosain TaxID=85552 RepID=A0AAW0V365_SCYPA